MKEGDSLKGDAEVVRRVVAGERQAYTELVRRYQNGLRSVLSFYCRSTDEVEEFLQEAFVQAYTHLDQYDLAAPFYPWLKAIAINALRMEIRRRESFAGQPAEYLLHLQLSQVQSDAEGSAAEARGAALRRCLEKLPKPQADLLVAKYSKGVSLAELAEGLKVTTGALKVRLLRLREALKDCIGRHLATEQR